MANDSPSSNDQLGLSPEEREQITAACRTIHEILLRHNYVKTNWSPMTGTAADGRVIVHKFTIGGYVKSHPPGYLEALGPDPADEGVTWGARP